jgi:hypothetical protein
VETRNQERWQGSGNRGCRPRRQMKGSCMVMVSGHPEVIMYSWLRKQPGDFAAEGSQGGCVKENTSR